MLSTQPKSVGKWKGWLNVHVVGENEASSVDWSRVLWWRQVEGETNQVLVLSEVEENNQEILEAKKEEYNKLVENDVFEWIEDTGEKTISTKWLIEEKCNPDGTKRTKARLVARGFEEQLVDKRVDSPTASRQALNGNFSGRKHPPGGGFYSGVLKKTRGKLGFSSAPACATARKSLILCYFTQKIHF